MMKAGIFDPYLDTLGGGERYCLTVAEALLKKDWQVDIFWPNDLLKNKLQDKFNLSIEKLNFIDYSPYGKNLWQRKSFEKNYDFLFYLSDGSIPFMFGKNNILHFQVPFQDVLKKNFLNSQKLKRINKVVCNSLFTKKIIDGRLDINSEVLYPPIDLGPIKPLKKENLILNVGRFSQLLQAKRQDILIDAFKKLSPNIVFKDWQLILAGGTEVGGEKFINRLRDMAKGYKIKISESPPFSELITLYGQAKIFWNASGYEINEEKEPQKVEHFGMTTVEAMAAGCVPIVLGKGGQKEIISNGKDGYLWQSIDDLINLTKKLIDNKDLIAEVSKSAMKRSRDFSKEKFYEKIYNLIE